MRGDLNVAPECLGLCLDRAESNRREGQRRRKSARVYRGRRQSGVGPCPVHTDELCVPESGKTGLKYALV